MRELIRRQKSVKMQMQTCISGLLVSAVKFVFKFYVVLAVVCAHYNFLKSILDYFTAKGKRSSS